MQNLCNGLTTWLQILALQLAEILENPHPDFYNMYDVFLDDTYLLYSQGLQPLKDTKSNLWFKPDS
ncbi:MAG: hypothetical protein IPK08_19845 [Bacteroidetes bacterium]|nr:hypothetical protein [Bacteroidota bacterium]